MSSGSVLTTSSSTKPASTTAADSCSALSTSACWSSSRWPIASRCWHGLLVALVADLLEVAQFVVDAVERGARGGQCLLGEHALLERGLALLFQRLDRRVAVGELRRQFAQARIELAALAAHAIQRLRQAR